MGIAAVQEAEKAGVKLTKLDSKGDLTLQLSQIQNLIQMNVDLIVLFPDNGTTVIPTLKTAHEAGIPVVLVTTIIDEEGFPYVNAYAGANNIEEGEIAGKLTVEAASKAGFTKENPAKMVELTGPAGNVMSMLRSQGWHNYVDEAENIEVLDTQPADYNMEKSQQFVENWIIKHPDLWGVYAAGSGMSLGTCAAIKNAGKTGEIKVFTLSVLKAGYDLFLEGAMDGGSILSPYRDAEMAFDVAMKILNGEDYDFYNYTVVQEITPENVETLERPTW
jgi:ribose transport system substrate-binding protein